VPRPRPAFGRWTDLGVGGALWSRTGASAARCVFILFGGPPRAVGHFLGIPASISALSAPPRNSASCVCALRLRGLC